MPEAHLLIMTHGMWGNIGHFDFVVSQLVARGAVNHDSGSFSAEMLPAPPAGHELPLIVYRTHSNEGYFTYDGIDVCGTRVANEICNEIEVLEQQGVNVTKLSVMGYSMGGLMIRYAVGVLYTRNVFDTVEPGTFTTFYSPHIGVNVLGSQFSARAFNFIGSWAMARTSRQVFLRDIYSKSGTPLFLHMSEPDSPYIKALDLFKSKTLYANVINDRRCDYYTAAIEETDPFFDKHTHIDGPFVSNFGRILLKGTKDLKFTQTPRPVHTKPVGFLLRVYRLLTTAVKAAIVIPTWFVAFLLNAGFQTVISTARTSNMIRLGQHVPEYEYTAIDNFLEQEANGMVEEMYDAVHTEETRLKLTPTMRKIIQNLNSVGWDKYPVHITADKNAHSAAIVRTPVYDTYWEGKYVVKHWLEQVLGFQPDWSLRPNV